jgi:hypothetical protein
MGQSAIASIAEASVKNTALLAATGTGLAMVFIPSPMTPVTIPAGIAILYATYRVSTKGNK